MTIEEYFGDWVNVVDLEQADSIMKKLISSKDKVCPEIKNIFKAFRLCSFHNLRVVIIGMDPYPDLYNGKPRATGIAFANSSEIPEKDYSPSLKILMESVINFTIPHQIVTFDSSLEKWEEQGVLLLNSALSCKQGEIGSHTLLWRPFLKSLLTNLSEHTTGIIYVLMGNDAQSFETCINKQFNFVLKTRHPSYYARSKTKMPSDIWQKVNDILVGQNGYGIEWYRETEA